MLPQPLMYHQLVYFKHINTVYLFGGKSTPNHTNIYQRSIYKWNISNHSSWFELINTTTPTVNFSSYGNNVVEVNNKAYFIGIYDGSWASGQIYVFDPSNDSFLNHNLTSAPDISSQGCLTTNKTHILMAGGRHSIESFCDDLQIYDTQRNVWDLQQIHISPIYHNGIYAQYCVMVNNTLFTFGGSSQNVYLNEYYKFESIEDNLWSLLGTKSTSTRSGAAVYYNKLNRIYLIGGFAGHSPVSNIDDFDVAEQKIVATYHTVQPLFGAPAFISNDKLYIFGGGNYDSSAISLVQVCNITDFYVSAIDDDKVIDYPEMIIIAICVVLFIFIVFAVGKDMRIHCRRSNVRHDSSINSLLPMIAK